MVESNHEEERLARVEQMIEALQRESVALRMVTGQLAISVETLVSPPISVSGLKRRKNDARR